MINIAAEFCFWTEQRQNGSSHFVLGLAKTLEVLNAKMAGNSLVFMMVN
jgi:hypothetical protein